MGATRERWLPIRGWSAYEVSDHGRVRSYWRLGGRMPRRVDRSAQPHVLAAARAGRAGHLKVALVSASQCRQVYVHVLVLRAFVGPRPRGYWGLHYDGQPTNNTLANLRYGTPKENSADAKRIGSKLGGPRTIPDRAVTAVRAAVREGALSITQIARKCGVGRTTVQRIADGSFRP